MAPKITIDAASTTPPPAMLSQRRRCETARGQLAYDTQQLDPRKAARLLRNRASAARSLRRRAERAREAEAALARSRAENVTLQEQLAAPRRRCASSSSSDIPRLLLLWQPWNCCWRWSRRPPQTRNGACRRIRPKSCPAAENMTQYKEICARPGHWQICRRIFKGALPTMKLVSRLYSGAS